MSIIISIFTENDKSRVQTH